MTLQEHIDHAVKYGFDRLGPGNLAQGPPCFCCWDSVAHGNKCPEHGWYGRDVEQAKSYAGKE